MAGTPPSEGATTRWQIGQVLGVQSVCVWQTTPMVITSTAAMSTTGTITRQIVVRPGMQYAQFEGIETLGE